MADLPRKVFLGGSFNPIHHGHLLCARAAAEALGIEKVILIPTAISPLKLEDKSAAPAADRLEMCRLAIDQSPDFELDDREIRRSGPSFTIDSARQLRGEGATDVIWLIGADLFSGLPKWHEPDALLKEVRFVLMARPGWAFDPTSIPQKFAFLIQNIVEVPQIDIASTDIRRRVKAGLSIDFLTPPPVVRFIHQRGLYR